MDEKKKARAMDKGNTHLLSCKIFRFGWLLSVNDLKSTLVSSLLEYF